MAKGDKINQVESVNGVRRCWTSLKMPELCVGTGILSGKQRTFCNSLCRSRYYTKLNQEKQKRETDQRRIEQGSFKTKHCIRPTYPVQVNTPTGCTLIKAKTGRCAHYYDCIHASACLRLSMDLAGDGFTTKNGCPGYQPADPDHAASLHNPNYVYGNPYPTHCAL